MSREADVGGLRNDVATLIRSWAKDRFGKAVFRTTAEEISDRILALPGLAATHPDQREGGGQGDATGLRELADDLNRRPAACQAKLPTADQQSAERLGGKIAAYFHSAELALATPPVVASEVGGLTAEELIELHDLIPDSTPDEDLCLEHYAIRRLLRAPAGEPATRPEKAWRTIDSAPVAMPDGPVLRALVSVDFGADGSFVGEARQKCGDDGPEWWWANEDSEYGEIIHPTHWMSLPAGPDAAPEPRSPAREEGGALRAAVEGVLAHCMLESLHATTSLRSGQGAHRRGAGQEAARIAVMLEAALAASTTGAGGAG